jgi:hypothetical protein
MGGMKEKRVIELMFSSYDQSSYYEENTYDYRSQAKLRCLLLLRAAIVGASACLIGTVVLTIVQSI